MSVDKNIKFVPAVENAVTILRLLVSSGRPMGATSIARETGQNVSSVFNILRTLAHEKLIAFDPLHKTYVPGIGLLELSAPLLGANPTELIRPLLNDIAQKHQVMLALWHITRTERVVLIDRFTPERIVQAVIARNSRLPVFSGAIGRCYAAATGLTQAQARTGYASVRWQSEPGFDAYCLEITASLARDSEGIPRFGISSITIAGQHDPESQDAVAISLADAAKQIERGVFNRTSDT